MIPTLTPDGQPYFVDLCDIVIEQAGPEPARQVELLCQVVGTLMMFMAKYHPDVVQEVTAVIQAF